MNSFIMYFTMYLSYNVFILIIGVSFGIIIYSYFKDDYKNNRVIKLKSNNEEILYVIKTLTNDLIINNNKYSFIEINDTINIIIDIYIKNKYDFNEGDNINSFIENKRNKIINDIKIKLLINYKNDLINKIIMEKNILNTTLTINHLKSIKNNINNHKKELNELFDLVNEINLIDIRIIND